jgi:hypothetical protein
MSNLNNFLFFYEKEFYKIKHFMRAKTKSMKFKLVLFQSSFQIFKLLLISKSCFEIISKTNQPFTIDESEGISNHELLYCFEKIYSLLSKKESIEVSIENFIVYQYLSKIIKNQSLLLVCDEVESTKKSKLFILSSTCFLNLTKEIDLQINNFEIILKDEVVIKCNDILGSLLSARIEQVFGKLNSVDFSSYEHTETILELFSVLKRNIISIEKFNQELLISTILFVEITLLKNLINFSFEEFTSFSKSTKKQILSSSFLQFTNENELFKFVSGQINLDQNQLDLIQYIYF